MNKINAMKKQVYQRPCASAYKLMGKTVLSTSIIIGGSGDSGKVSDENDIGFVKEEDSQKKNFNIWDNEW